MITGAFAKQSAHVGLLARGAGLEGALRDVEPLSGKGVNLQADVSDPDQVEQSAEKVETQFGPIGAHGVFDPHAHSTSPLQMAAQHLVWIAQAALAGATCDALANGPEKFWRGGMIGLALGTLGVIGLGELEGSPGTMGLPESLADGEVSLNRQGGLQ